MHRPLRDLGVADVRLWPEHSYRDLAERFGCAPSSVLRKFRGLDPVYLWRFKRRTGPRQRTLEYALYAPHQERFLHERAEVLANELGVSSRTVYRARKKLRQYLAADWWLPPRLL